MLWAKAGAPLAASRTAAAAAGRKDRLDLADMSASLGC
jgi:hypothetical protein